MNGDDMAYFSLLNAEKPMRRAVGRSELGERVDRNLYHNPPRPSGPIIIVRDGAMSQGRTCQQALR